MRIFKSYGVHTYVKLSCRITCIKGNSNFVIIDASSNHIRRIITGSVTIDTTLPASFLVEIRSVEYRVLPARWVSNPVEGIAVESAYCGCIVR